MRDRLAILVTLAVVAGPRSLVGQAAANFDHAKHGKLFASCTACHLGAVERDAPIWPDAASCASCHDGTIQKRVAWQPRREAARTNLRFDHRDHVRAAVNRPAACVACHQQQGAPWMTVAALDAQRCVDCHGIRTAHLAAPDTACATCHLPLARAARLTVKDVAAFPTPPSHEQSGYAGADGHGQAARAAGANCATCHAREFCLQCHVDAPERREIQALASDPRSAGIRAELQAPASHEDPDFLGRHGASAQRAPVSCVACHTRESCLTCHAASTRVAARLPAASPDRGRGAVVTRRRPPSHGANYAARHA
ncbi:MAG TPA: cytochrome c3 family protein, partial [Gemmatimonadales bacterium]